MKKTKKDKNIWAISDIHGRNDLLQLLMKKLETDEKLDLNEDKLVFLGDYIDRGPDSFEVLVYVRDLFSKYPDNVVILGGNHEKLAIDACVRGMNYDDVYLWSINGGDRTRDSIENNLGVRNFPQDWLRWLINLPLFHKEPGFFFSHAPLPRESFRQVHRRGQPFDRDDYTWTYNRDEFGVARDIGKGTIGVCGHVHALRNGVMEPRLYTHYYYVDAGCGCSLKAPLVAVEVQTKKVIYAWPKELKDED